MDGLRRILLSSCIVGLTLAVPAALADSKSGAYLAGRHALQNNDFDTAAQFFSRALVRDPGNSDLMEDTVLSFLATGQLDRAMPVALAIEEKGLRSQVAHMVVLAGLAEQQKFDEILARDIAALGIGPLVDGLVNAWAHLGAGSVGDALAAFDTVAGQNGLSGFANYHKAMALAMVGDFEGAEAIFSDESLGRVMMTRRGAMARAEILSQLGRNADALSILAESFGRGFDPSLTAMADNLAAGNTLPFSHVTSARDGIAEVFFSVAAALNNEANDQYTLIYGQIAAFLRPEHIDGALLVAQLLHDLEQYDQAIAVYKSVPVSSPDFFAAEQGRADALSQSGRPDTAIEVLEQLALDFPNLPSVHTALGDLHRQQDSFASAVTAYDKALELTEDGARTEWFLHYVRGICHERLGNWPEAEADFRAALAIRPNQPQVLNYLGYSMVEKQINLDEALDMIERAVAAQPDSGYIVDSLGWVLYRLGRFEEAVGHMERAVELMPIDPVVNDHLGDVYWAVGRYREAEFQWKRALSFVDPEDTQNDADPDRIRAKLEVGLDQVLADEGAPPLKVANDDG